MNFITSLFLILLISNQTFDMTKLNFKLEIQTYPESAERAQAASDRKQTHRPPVGVFTSCGNKHIGRLDFFTSEQ